ncbi:MAG: hypothetical protein ABIP97_09195 [Chthoniobacterales bacterium]
MTPLERLRIVAPHLSATEVHYAFLGGSVLPLLVDIPELMDFRPTKDADAVVVK